MPVLASCKIQSELESLLTRWNRESFQGSLGHLPRMYPHLPYRSIVPGWWLSFSIPASCFLPTTLPRLALPASLLILLPSSSPSSPSSPHSFLSSTSPAFCLPIPLVASSASPRSLSPGSSLCQSPSWSVGDTGKSKLGTIAKRDATLRHTPICTSDGKM